LLLGKKSTAICFFPSFLSCCMGPRAGLVQFSSHSREVGPGLAGRGYGNLPSLFPSFFLFSLLTTIFSLLNPRLRHGNRDMMHIKQARERTAGLGWQGRTGQGRAKMVAGCFGFVLVWGLGFGVWIVLCYSPGAFFPFILQQSSECDSVTYDQLNHSRPISKRTLCGTCTLLN